MNVAAGLMSEAQNPEPYTPPLHNEYVYTYSILLLHTEKGEGESRMDDILTSVLDQNTYWIRIQLVCRSGSTGRQKWPQKIVLKFVILKWISLSWMP